MPQIALLLVTVVVIVIAIVIFVAAVYYIYKSNNKSKNNSLTRIDPYVWRSWFSNRESLHEPASIRKGTIFVSVASYRDSECSLTVKSLVENAARPDLLRIVVCQQNGAMDPDCGGHGAIVKRLWSAQARGPTYARWLIQKEIRDEEFFLQIDSHTRMTKNWDTKVVDQLNLCPSERPVLTQYLSEYDLSTNELDDRVRGGLFVDRIDENDKFIRVQSEFVTPGARIHPFPATAWSACFSFSRTQFARDAPYDANTPFLFFGEEQDIALRSFTRGWDFFSPSENIAWTNFGREHRKTFWENPLQKPLETLSRFRVYLRLGYIGVDSIPGAYAFLNASNLALGDVRTVADWEKQAGITMPRL